MRPTRNQAVLLVLALVLAILAFVAIPRWLPSADTHEAVTPQKSSEQWWIDRHARKVEEMEQGNIDLLMIGDSITHLWEDPRGTKFVGYPHGATVWQQYYSRRRALNLGFAGDRTQHVLWRLDHLPLDRISPKAAVLLIGTNNITRKKSSPRRTAEGIHAIVRKLHDSFPDLNILVLHVFPRGEKPESKRRDQIRKLNALLPELLQNESNLTLLDLGDRFLNPDRTIPPSLMPDFLHLNETGYRIWAHSMEPTLRQLLGE